MNNVMVRLIDMPCTVRGCVVRHIDGEEYYTILLNSHLSADMQRKTYLHELSHIEEGDFSKCVSADCIERMRH